MLTHNLKSKLLSIPVILLICLIELALIKFIFFTAAQYWNPAFNLIFVPLFFINFKIIKLNFKSIADKWFWILFLSIAAAVVLTPLHSSDLYAYYLPNADQLNNFNYYKYPLIADPYNLTFAYPPLEYFLISIIKECFNGFEIALKVIILLKSYSFLFLFIKLLRGREYAGLICGFLLLPFAFNNILISYYQDINLLFVVLLIVQYLIYKKCNTYLLFVFLVYALLSKYTFLPYFGVYIMFLVLKKHYKILKISLLACIPFLLFMLKNYFLYNDPLFPVLHSFFRRIEPFRYLPLVNNLPKIELSFLYLKHSLIILLGTPLLAYQYFSFKKGKVEKVVWVGLLVMVWVFFLQLPGAGASIRFLFPVLLLIIFLSANNKHIGYLVILSYIAFGIFSWGDKIAMASAALSIVFHICILLKMPYKMALAGVAVSFLIFRIVTTEINITKSGVEYALPGYSLHCEILRTHPNCFTDLSWGISPALQKEKNIYLLSDYAGFKAIQQMQLTGINYLYVTKYTIKDYPFLIENFTPVETNGMFTLYKRY